ncbi:olfactory receptor 1J21-like [Pyxicephalus adspersus]|uniref:Olfactory receptor n=1 Tax=Pyxicephalus adspersus TaxID=30357 RepID=A0AAV2ZSM3_PYXAD|nr:TPA: hypothetical protein GDO54_004148 [Pyxicephalus adspersus]
MHKCENSTANIFHILAFSTSNTGQCLLFIVVLLMLLITVLGNVIITVLVCLVSQLRTPMYFFLGNLAITDIMFVLVIFPKLLSILQTQDNRMFFSSCMSQVYFFSFLGTSDSLVMTCMAYDRYVAICKPLQYLSIMSRDVCILLSLCSWLLSIINGIINAIVTSELSFCPEQNINHFFCDQKTLYAITSSDATNRNILMVFQDVIVASLPFLLIITSYVLIIATILKIRTAKGRRKAFSSCTSHVTTVILFYGPVIVIYAKPDSEGSQELDKLLTLLYTAVVPMLNPFVYTLRNKEILDAIHNLTKKGNVFLMRLFKE